MPQITTTTDIQALVGTTIDYGKGPGKVLYALHGLDASMPCLRDGLTIEMLMQPRPGVRGGDTFDFIPYGTTYTAA